jgi:hypothetical protein
MMRWQLSLSGIIVFIFLRMVPAVAQEFDPASVIAAQVQLDSVVIVASKSGFDVGDFIRMVQEDESMYEAFHNLRSTSYHFQTTMTFVDKHDEEKATYVSSNSQYYDGSCRTMQTHSENWSGDFFKGKKQKHRYYTYALYDRLFLTHGRVCDGIDQGSSASKERSSMENHVDELKTLIFRPGKKADIPLIGKKTELFSDEMIGLYDFKIDATQCQNVPCYTFTAIVKEDYIDKENKTVFKSLTTTFSKTDFQVMRRSYHLTQRTAVYLFDVSMDVELEKIGTQYYPSRVSYAGTWNIPTKRKESGSFTITFSEFK